MNITLAQANTFFDERGIDAEGLTQEHINRAILRIQALKFHTPIDSDNPPYPVYLATLYLAHHYIENSDTYKTIKRDIDNSLAPAIADLPINVQSALWPFIDESVLDLSTEDYQEEGRHLKVYMYDGESGETSPMQTDPVGRTSVLVVNDIPNLPASKITSGVFQVERIPDIPYSKVTGAPSGGGGGTSDFSGDYDDLTNKPTLFSGDYDDLTNKPDLFSGSYNDLTDKPTIPVAFSGNYNDLTNKPTIPTPFSGDYNDLTNKPTIPESVEQGVFDARANPLPEPTASQKAKLWLDPVAKTGYFLTEEFIHGTAPTGTFEDYINSHYLGVFTADTQANAHVQPSDAHLNKFYWNSRLHRFHYYDKITVGSGTSYFWAPLRNDNFAAEFIADREHYAHSGDTRGAFWLQWADNEQTLINNLPGNLPTFTTWRAYGVLDNELKKLDSTNYTAAVNSHTARGYSNIAVVGSNVPSKSEFDALKTTVDALPVGGGGGTVPDAEVLHEAADVSDPYDFTMREITEGDDDKIVTILIWRTGQANYYPITISGHALRRLQDRSGTASKFAIQLPFFNSALAFNSRGEGSTTWRLDWPGAVSDLAIRISIIAPSSGGGGISFNTISRFHNSVTHPNDKWAVAGTDDDTPSVYWDSPLTGTTVLATNTLPENKWRYVINHSETNELSRLVIPEGASIIHISHDRGGSAMFFIDDLYIVSYDIGIDGSSGQIPFLRGISAQTDANATTFAIYVALTSDRELMFGWRSEGASQAIPTRPRIKVRVA